MLRCKYEFIHLRGGRDGILLTAVSGPLKKNDVVLYRRANGQFILHRIIRAGEYVHMAE
ncbi:MAG: hypothetical protein Q4G19_09010 [Clostridia bacterium]|nr:hypothetical protein [Clostridia bacterium]